MRSLAFCIILISWLTSGFSADKFLEPSYAKNFYYLSDKYAINVQSYREYGDLWVFDLPYMDLFRDPDLKFKIGEVDDKGIVLNDTRICKVGKSGDINFLKSTLDLPRFKNGKKHYPGYCFGMKNGERQDKTVSFLEYKASNDLSMMQSVSRRGEFIDGYYTINIFVSELKNNIAKVETKEYGTFYFDTNVLKEFRMKVAPPVEEFLKQHPLGAELMNELANVDESNKNKVFGNSYYKAKIGLNNHKLFEAAKDVLCFEKLTNDFSKPWGRWCYYNKYFCASAGAGIDRSIDVEKCKEIVERMSAMTKKERKSFAF